MDLTFFEKAAKVIILERTMDRNIDSCQYGTRERDPSPKYKCRLLNNLYGNFNDSIFSIKYYVPLFIDYDDSCNVIGHGHLISNSSCGEEQNLIEGDTVWIFCGIGNSLIAVRDDLCDLDKFTISHFEDLKNISKKIHIGNSTKSLGQTKASEICCITLLNELNGTTYTYIPYVAFYKDGITNIYKTLPYKPKHANRKLETWDPTIIRTFKMKNHKILISEGIKRTKLIIP